MRKKILIYYLAGYPAKLFPDIRPNQYPLQPYPFPRIWNRVVGSSGSLMVKISRRKFWHLLTLKNFCVFLCSLFFLSFLITSRSANVFRSSLHHFPPIFRFKASVTQDYCNKTGFQVCNTSLEPYNMKNHIKGKHYLSMLQYKSNFGEIEFIREVYHR